MPGARVFIDTNILLYFHERDGHQKKKTVRTWMDMLSDRQAARINLQVLNELTHVLLRKTWFETVDQAFAAIDNFAELGAAPITLAEVATARTIHLRYRYSWWDCLLLASALELGCEFFLSEDLQDGQAIEGLTIVDPFAHSPRQVLASR